jgi:hypothetical protein
MREVIRGNITPQQKAVSVNARFGNTNVKKQQGSSVELYDTLPLTIAQAGQGTTLRFFEDAQTRTFPDTNLENSNQLSVGETLVTENIYFTIITEDGGALKTAGGFPLTNELARAEFSIEIANSVVLKRLPVMSTIGIFNESAGIDNQVVYQFYTQLVIPPLLNFAVALRIPAFTLAAASEIRCNIAGVGSLLAPRTTF